MNSLWVKTCTIRSRAPIPPASKYYIFCNPGLLQLSRTQPFAVDPNFSCLPMWLHFLPPSPTSFSFVPIFTDYFVECSKTPTQ